MSRDKFDKPRARSSDPSTSHDAAAAAAPMVRGHQALVLLALALGPAGKDAIARRAGLGGNQVARRIKDLFAAGLIALTGRLVRSDAGRPEREWMVSGAAPI